MRFYVFQGDTYYSQPGWNCYVGCADIIEEARELINADPNDAEWWQIVDQETMSVIEGKGYAETGLGTAPAFIET